MCLKSEKRISWTFKSGKYNFSFTQTPEETVLALLQKVDPSKAVGLDNLGGRLLKYGATELSRPVSQLIYISIKSSVFPEQCKISKLKHYIRTALLLYQKTIGQFHYFLFSQNCLKKLYICKLKII